MFHGSSPLIHRSSWLSPGSLGPNGSKWYPHVMAFQGHRLSMLVVTQHVALSTLPWWYPSTIQLFIAILNREPETNQQTWGTPFWTNPRSNELARPDMRGLPSSEFSHGRDEICHCVTRKFTVYHQQPQWP